MREFAAALHKFYEQANHSNVRVFHRPPPGQPPQARGKLEGREFLFDILVAEVERYHPAGRQEGERHLSFIRRPLIQVESEFAQATSETLVDASKLVCGSAPLSLVVVPASQRESTRKKNRYLRALACLAPAFHERDLLCALVPHPKDWGPPNPAAKRIVLYRCQPTGEWERVAGCEPRSESQF